jgi:hypothetical protein
MTQAYGTMDDTDCRTAERSTVKEVCCSKYSSSKRRAGVSFLLLRISSPGDGLPSHSEYSIIYISKHVSNWRLAPARDPVEGVSAFQSAQTEVEPTSSYDRRRENL